MKHDDPNLAVRSVIAVPMMFRDRFFGVLAVTNPVDNRFFTEMEFTLMQSLAEQAALALHNAELLSLQIERKQLDLDLSIASGIQQMLLPSPVDRVPGPRPRRAVLPRPEGRRRPLRRHRALADPPRRRRGRRLRQGHRGLALHGGLPHEPAPDRATGTSRRRRPWSSSTGRWRRTSTADLYVTMLYAVIDIEANAVTFARGGPRAAALRAAGAARPGPT